LNCIDKINSLSRETAVQNYTIEELALKLREIENEQRYSFWIIMFFGALSAGGFAVFFGGNYLEAGCSFLIGLLIKAVSALMEQRGLHGFFTNAIAAASGALAALGAHALCPDTDVDILIISSIMLLVPGLAITNAIRDTVSGDYLSGVARATEAFLVAIAIAAGIGVVLSMSIGLSGGM
ncbi:threonine/serine exporter family protein, partial [[Clostridium] innocuum]|nr:threonine/serine exporter family protein [[Clostridium] innocuum]